MRSDIDIRDATAVDAAAITAIYRNSVLHGTGTFELEPPSIVEMEARRAKLIRAGYPYLVAAGPTGVVGYAYAGPFRERPAYRLMVEDSVYVAETARGDGVGRLLLEALIVRTEQAGFRQMLALVGDSANTGSIHLHAACGFQLVGTMAAVGFKLGRWLDVVIMQRALGEGASSLPMPTE